MEQAMQATCLCVLAAVLALVVKRGSPETALLLVLWPVCMWNGFRTSADHRTDGCSGDHRC